MAILVTGGAGFIGGHTVLALVESGEIPIVLDNLSTGNRIAVPPNVRLIVGDVGDTDLVSGLIRDHQIDSIMHFAAKIILSESVTDPLSYYLTNTVKTHALLQVAVRANVKRFVFSSTAAVYGNPSVTPVTETADPAPLSPYGRSKLMSENILRDVSVAHNLQHAILRYFNVTGADPSGRNGQLTPGAAHLIKVAVETALGLRGHMSIYGNDYPTPDGTCIRDYVHVSDLARAHLTALDHLRNGGDSLTLNCGYGRGYSVLEVLDEVRKVTATEFEIRQASRRAGDPASIVANSNHLKRLGWQPKFDSLPTMIEHAFNWEKSLANHRHALR